MKKKVSILCEIINGLNYSHLWLIFELEDLLLLFNLSLIPIEINLILKYMYILISFHFIEKKIRIFTSPSEPFYIDLEGIAPHKQCWRVLPMLKASLKNFTGFFENIEKERLNPSN